MLVMLMVGLTMVTRTVQDCKMICSKNSEKEVVKCTKKECFLKTKDYNWREVPKGDTELTTRRDDVDKMIPCCPLDDEDLASNNICRNYRQFERKLEGTPVRVWLDFKVLKIYHISMPEDHYSAVMWLQMSWMDPRLEICRCGQKEQGRTVAVELAGGEREKVWLPDLHIWEARKFDRMWGLAREREKVKVMEEGGKPIVVYDINFKAVLACHFNTSHFPLARNKCSVRFGSYAKDYKKVVFEQNSSYISTKINHPKFTLEMFPLQEKDKQVSRDQPRTGSDKITMAYDGFQIIVKEKPGSVEFQYLVTMWVLVSLGLLGIFLLSGQPNPIDRAGLFAMALLGSVLLLVQITTNTPHGYESQATPLVAFIEVSIGVIVTCFACYCILVRLTSDGLIMGLVQDKMELVVLVGVLPSYMVWCIWFIWWNLVEARKEVCHNLVH